MEILDQEEQPSNSNKQPYYQYLLSSWIAIMGPMVLIDLGVKELRFLIETGLGMLGWLGIVAGLVVLFYKKIMQKDWYRSMSLLALFISSFVSVFFVNNVLGNVLQSAMITGFFFYISHTATILAFAVIYYYNNNQKSN